MALKKIAIASIITLLYYKMFSSNKKPSTGFIAINGNGNLRGCDAFGCGNFGATRGGRGHNGIDFVTTEGQGIRAPFDCKVVRYGYPYADDMKYRLVEIQGTGEYASFKAKIMYIKPGQPVGAVLKAGTQLCTSDSIARKYGSKMANHVHFELYQDGKLVDPTSFFTTA